MVTYLDSLYYYTYPQAHVSILTIDIGSGEHGNVAESDAEPEEDEDSDGAGESCCNAKDYQAKGYHQQSLLPAKPAKEE